MKKLLLAAFIMIAADRCLAQSVELPVDSVTHKVTYTEVVEVDGVAKAELYLRAKEWAVRNLGSQVVIQSDDKEAGSLILKVTNIRSFKYALSTQSFYLKYVMYLWFKDGKFKYEITDISVPDVNPLGYHLTLDEIVVAGTTSREKTKNDDGSYRKRFKGYISESSNFFDQLLDGLKATMNKKSAADF